MAALPAPAPRWPTQLPPPRSTDRDRAESRSGSTAAPSERGCAHAERLVSSIGELPGAEVVAKPVINQGLVRFLSRGGNHDQFTDEVIRRIHESTAEMILPDTIHNRAPGQWILGACDPFGESRPARALGR